MWPVYVYHFLIKETYRAEIILYAFCIILWVCSAPRNRIIPDYSPLQKQCGSPRQTAAGLYNRNGATSQYHLTKWAAFSEVCKLR